MVMQNSCCFDLQRPFGDGWQPELPLRERPKGPETLSYTHGQFLSGMLWSLVRGRRWGQTDLSLFLLAL